MLTVAFTVPAPTEADTLATSGSLPDDVGNRVDALHHRLERNALGGIGYADDHAGVLLRQQTFRHDDVEQNGRDERDDRDDQNESLMRQHPAQPAFVQIAKARPDILLSADRNSPRVLASSSFSARNSFAHIIGVSVSETNAGHADRHAHRDREFAK